MGKNQEMEENSKNETSELKNRTIRSFYIFSYVSLLILLISVIFLEANSKFTGICALITTMFFALALLVDTLESTDRILESKALKYFFTITGILISTYGLIKANGSVNEILGVDPTNAPITVAALTVFHIIKDGSYIIGMTFFVLLLLFSPILAAILLPGIPEGMKAFAEKVRANDKEKSQPFFPTWLVLVSRSISLFFIFVLGSVFTEDRPNFEEVFIAATLEFMYFADFNNNNHCIGEAENKPVLFIAPNRVLLPVEKPKDINNLFKTAPCYSPNA
jgi:hypothetical protein